MGEHLGQESPVISFSHRFQRDCTKLVWIDASEIAYGVKVVVVSDDPPKRFLCIARLVDIGVVYVVAVSPRLFYDPQPQHF